jgi:cytochrome c5
MHYKNKKIAISLLVIVTLVACKSALYIPVAENVTKNANIDELVKGRASYIDKCSSCHSLYLPEKFTKEEWAKRVDKMAPKAKITDHEKQLILEYVTKGE